MNKLNPKTILLTLISSAIQIGIAGIGLAIIVFIFYATNWSNINSFNAVGTDSFSAYTYVEWINKFFPDVPFWYPVQGAGVSFIASYPFLSHYLVVLFHRITDISLIRSFNILEFSSFLITAIGIFIYCWTRLEYPKNKVSRQAIGIVAAILYLIAPLTYVYATPWGFYAETVSYMFTAPTLILLDYFIDKHFKEQHDWKKRLALLVGILFYTLTFLTHFSTGVGLTNVFLILILGRVVSSVSLIGIKKSFITGITVGVCIYISLTGLFAWRFANFQDYSAEVAKGGFSGYTNSSIKLSDIDEKRTLHLKQVLGLEYYNNSDPRRSLNDWALQPFIWILAAIGGTLGGLRSRKMYIFGIMATYGLLTLSLPIILFILNKIGIFAELLNARSVWTIYRMIVPILAAYGLYILCELPFTIVDKLIKKTPSLIQFNWNTICKPLIIIILMGSLTVYLAFIINYAKVEKGRDNSRIQRIGTGKISTTNLWKQVPANYKVTIYDPSQDKEKEINVDSSYTPEELYYICKENPGKISLINEMCEKALNKETNRIILLSQADIQKTTNYCINKNEKVSEYTFRFCNTLNVLPLSYQLNPGNWPPLDVTKADFSDINKEKEFFSLIRDKPLDTRYDLSGLTGSIIMRAPLLTNVSQTQVYINNLSLFSALWNYQSSVMYSDQPINQKPGVITELAQYFGYEYIYQATNSQTAAALFDNDENWEKTEKPNWRHFKKPTTLTTWTNKPAVLFVGNENTFLYDQFFKIANLGIIPYDKATMFAGSRYIDDYSLEELSLFNVLFLEGYNYHNQSTAFTLLDSYIKNGGNLFIDTGWRYEAPDWELSAAPPFFPTNNLKWKEASPRSRMILDKASAIGMEGGQTDIGFLTNYESAWGISVPQDIRDGAEVILQSNNTPLLIAKSHGKGRVIWSGMNIIPHIEGGKNENEKEIEVLKHSLQWLINNTTNTNTDYQVSVSRPSPDKVQFVFNEKTDTTTTLYWRESFHPKWHAYLKKENKTQEIETYRAGPRLTGMRLPPIEKHQTITFKVESTPKEIILNILGITTLTYLILYTFGITSALDRTVSYYLWRTKNKVQSVKTENATFKVHDNPSDEE